MNYNKILVEFKRFAPKYQIIEMCLAALNNTNDHQEQSNLPILIGRCYRSLKEYIKAEKYFDKAFEKTMIRLCIIRRSFKNMMSKKMIESFHSTTKKYGFRLDTLKTI